MSYRVEVAPAAARQLRTLDRRRVVEYRQASSFSPTTPAPAERARSSAATANGESVRATTAIVYEVHDDVLLVLVVAIGHQRDIYRGR